MSISQSILLQSQQNWTFFILPLHIPHSYDVLKYLLRKFTKQAGAELVQAQLKLGLDFN